MISVLKFLITDQKKKENLDMHQSSLLAGIKKKNTL